MNTRSATRLPNPSVSQLIGLLVEAYCQPPHKIVDDIARMAAMPNGRDSDPTRETILNYIKKENSQTLVHYKFAHLVINYLDGRRQGGEHVEVSSALTDSNEWRQVRRLCKGVLEAERERRFERPLANNSDALMTIGALTGVYAVCRRESSDAKYHQELLIMNNSGTKSAPRCHCTFVTTHSVTRGEWMLLENIVYCGLSGLREDNSREIAGLYLAHLSGRDLLSGFLAGPGTDLKLPVAMPVVAIKVPAPSRSMSQLGDLGDEAILRAFRKVRPDLSGITKKLHEILADQMEPVVFNATKFHSDIRSNFDGGRHLIDPKFLEFCKSSIP